VTVFVPLVTVFFAVSVAVVTVFLAVSVAVDTTGGGAGDVAVGVVVVVGGGGVAGAGPLCVDEVVGLDGAVPASAPAAGPDAMDPVGVVASAPARPGFATTIPRKRA
jgi:hypothetical protein